MFQHIAWNDGGKLRKVLVGKAAFQVENLSLYFHKSKHSPGTEQ
jgi:hypothetical protein